MGTSVVGIGVRKYAIAALSGATAVTLIFYLGKGLDKESKVKEQNHPTTTTVHAYPDPTEVLCNSPEALRPNTICYNP